MKKYLVLLSVVLSLLMVQTAAADLAPVTWYLLATGPNEVTWSDWNTRTTGGTVIGNFTYDPSTQEVTAWNLTVTNPNENVGPTGPYYAPTPFTMTDKNGTTSFGTSGDAVDLIFNTVTSDYTKYYLDLEYNGTKNDLAGSTPLPLLTGFYHGEILTSLYTGAEIVGVASGGTLVPTPLPPSVLLLGSGLVGLAALGRRKFRKS